MSTATTATCLAAALLAAGCGASSSDIGAATEPPTPRAEPPGATPTLPDASGPPSLPRPLACSAKAELAGDLEWKLTLSDAERRFRVHVPKAYDRAKPTPVVLNFHGYTSNGEQQDWLSGMSAKADAAGFIAVHAEGTGSSPGWNAGVCCGEAASGATDDVGFVGKIIDELTTKLCVDTRRVFVTGMSNGAFLAHRLACEMSSRIAAIAPVAGVLGVPACNPVRPMSVFQFHGTFDSVVPYSGNAQGFGPVLETVAGWASRSGCRATAREITNKGDVTCVTYDGCKGGAEVNLCTVKGGGHTWPGGMPVPPLGHTTTDIKATDVMWDFFLKHPLPE